jgi:hypothetical protein
VLDCCWFHRRHANSESRRWTVASSAGTRWHKMDWCTPEKRRGGLDLNMKLPRAFQTIKTRFARLLRASRCMLEWLHNMQSPQASSAACHVTQPQMRASRCPLRRRCRTGSVSSEQGQLARPRIVSKHCFAPAAPSRCPLLHCHSQRGAQDGHRILEDALLGRHGRQTNRGFVPQTPHTVTSYVRLASLRLGTFARAIGGSYSLILPFGPVCLVSQLSCGTSCPSLQLRFLTRRSPFAAITRSP